MKHRWETEKKNSAKKELRTHVEPVQPSPEQNGEAEQCSAGEQSQTGEAGSHSLLLLVFPSVTFSPVVKLFGQQTAKTPQKHTAQMSLYEATWAASFTLNGE